MDYNFEWDPNKARTNLDKHAIPSMKNLVMPRPSASIPLGDRHQRSSGTMKRGEMREEYDFSRAQRGKLSRPDAKLNLPVYLDDEVRAFVQAIAEKKKTDLSAVVNQLLRGDMQLAEAMK